MKAVMLAAGLGLRFEQGDNFPPKVLLRFGGKSLLQRHVEILRHLGVRELILGVGHLAGMIDDEIDRIGVNGYVRCVHNPQYKEGGITTLWALREEISSGDSIILMDADVLYDHRLMSRLTDCDGSAFVYDREFEPGDEPVKLCIRDGVIVDFHKQPTEAYDSCGEWVGFIRFAPDVAVQLPNAVAPYIEAGETDTLYEQSIRDLVQSLPAGTFAIEDITGLPWTEIDFQEDLHRAEQEILPRLEELP